MELFKHEINCLEEIGMLEKTGCTFWVFGMFIIPKKDGCIRWVSDFCALNKAIKQKFYPLPKISNIFACCKNYEFITKRDLSMHYYMFKLDEDSVQLCTIAMPFGLYKYK